MMRKVICCVGICLFFFVSTSHATLIGHWRLDETTGTVATDSISKNDGVLEGTPTWAPDPNGIDGAIHLAVTDRVALPNIDVGTSFTVMGWVKPDAHVIWGGLMASQYWDGFYLGCTDYQNWCFIVNGNFGLASGSNTFLIDKWQHVAGVYATGIATLYVNGAPVATQAMSAPSVPNQPVVIGRPDAASVPGLLDDVAIFKSALSAAEILSIYNKGISGTSLNGPAGSQAHTPSPVDTENDVLETATLSWTAGTDPNTDTHVLYLGTDLWDVTRSTENDSNGDTTVTVLTGLGNTSHTPGLAGATTYYWRVDEKEASAGVIAKGEVWTFDTVNNLPVIITQPGKQILDAGGTAVFTVDATGVVSYRWAKGTPGSGVDLTDGGTVSGATTATLTITTVGSGDEDTYYCKLTNEAGTLETHGAELILKNLEGFWEFNGDLLDSVGSNNGVMADPNFDGGVNGTQGLILYGDDAVEIADVGAFDRLTTSVPFSLACWVKGPAGDGSLRPDGFNHQDDALISKLDAALGKGYELHVNRADLGGQITLWVSSSGTSLIEVDSVTRVLDDTWHHVVATYDGSASAGGVKIYIDGVDDALDINIDSLSPSDSTANNASLTIGARSGLTQHLFEGQLDNVRVYNYSLSSTEVADLYSAIAGPYCRERLAMDLNGDCIVSLPDFAIFAEQWLDCAIYPDCY